MSVKIPVPGGLVMPKSIRVKPDCKSGNRRKAGEKSKSDIGRSSRRKGHAFERQVARELRGVGYAQACRNLEYQQGQGIDIANVGIYDIQCKRKKTSIPMSDINEVPRSVGRVPVLVAKSDNCDVMAVMPFKHFLQLIKKSKD
jgi:hypothetical protein